MRRMAGPVGLYGWRREPCATLPGFFTVHSRNRLPHQQEECGSEISESRIWLIEWSEFDDYRG